MTAGIPVAVERVQVQGQGEAWLLQVGGVAHNGMGGKASFCRVMTVDGWAHTLL